MPRRDSPKKFNLNNPIEKRMAKKYHKSRWAKKLLKDLKSSNS